MQKKVFALDLDGTLTEHRTWITDENLAALDELKDSGLRLVIVGAGQVRRIFAQLTKILDRVSSATTAYSMPFTVKNWETLSFCAT